MRSFLLSRHYFALSSAASFIRNVCSVVVIILGFHRYGPQSIFLGYIGGYLLQVAILGAQILFSFRPRYSLVLTGSGNHSATCSEPVRHNSEARLAGRGWWWWSASLRRFSPPER